MVQTVDFITPVLNDPYAFGAVAAANALSDIYAMGATPVFGLNIVCFPVKSLPLGILEDVIRGGADIAKEAGMVIAGGHSVDDNTPKYGLAITGMVDSTQVVYKKGACPGDVLFLTKPLGTGIVTTAVERELCNDELEEQVYRLMVHLNSGAAKAMVKVGVSACTDISGFGLLGHLHEMLLAGGVAARVLTNSVPVMAETWDLARKGIVPPGSHNNYRYLMSKVNWDEKVPPEARIIQCDAQTSGGLLIAVAPERADQLQELLTKEGCLAAARIGEVVAGKPGTIEVLL